MLLSELQQILRNGESSGAEFKRDDSHRLSLAKEIAALANLEGGRLFLGVEDDGTVSGLKSAPAQIEEGVMNICRDDVQPPIIPFWETVVCDPEGRTRVGIVSIPANAPDKPYKARQGGHWITMIRVGTTSREAAREEEARLYQSSGLFRYELRPIPGATFADLDPRRLKDYLARVRQQDLPQSDSSEEWETLLTNIELMIRDRDRAIPTIGGIALFGQAPRRLLPQSGIRAVAYQGSEKDYAAAEDLLITGPIVPLLSKDGLVESGVITGAIEFARRHLQVQSKIDDNGQRVDRWSIPLEVIREAIVNAVAHRDYSLATMDIELNLFSDRVEVISPGRLPNGISIDSMRTGCRASRNELIKETLRDYQFIDARGLGIPRKIVAGMREHNGTEPVLIEEDNRFVVRLFK